MLIDFTKHIITSKNTSKCSNMDKYQLKLSLKNTKPSNIITIMLSVPDLKRSVCWLLGVEGVTSVKDLLEEFYFVSHCIV